jgi:hypothetical protein
MTQQITFQGIKGEVNESSPHGNYLVVRLSPLVTICGTYTNIWDWKESHDISSGFISLLAYVGFESLAEFKLAEHNLNNWVEKRGASIDCYHGDDKYQPCRLSKRSATEYECKLRGLEAEDIPELVRIAGGNYVFS